MQDVIVGTTVLSELEPGQWFLFICCLSADRKHIDQTAIRACEKGKPHNHPKDRPVWIYEFKAEGVIACHPSVWWKGGTKDEETYFHNTYDWTVDVCCCPESDMPGDVADKLNAELRQFWRDKWIQKVN